MMLAATNAILERTTDVWADRQDALDKLTESMLRDYDTLALTRWPTLKPLIRSLQAFGRDQFDYFHAGFNSHQLEAWDDYPPESVYSIVLNQIGYDLEVLQRSIEQRLAGSAGVTDTLRKTDKLAYLALQPAVKAGLLPADTTAVTYFQKSPVSRVIPYAPVALIGVPFTSLSVTRDLLAIPHEVGHYVFWHGRVPGTTEPLHEALRLRAFDALKKFVTVDSPEFPNWCYVWLEELFADVYGALTGGPVVALDFQDLALNAICTEFNVSDEDHPASIVRPDIYTRALSSAATEQNNWGIWATALNQRWQKRRVRCGGYLYFEADGHRIALSEAISPENAIGDTKPLDQMIEVCLNLIGPHTSDWSGDLSASAIADVDSLYDSLRAGLPRLLSAAPADLDPDPAEAFNWLNRAQDIVQPYPGDFVTVAEWQPRLIANGWTIEGPFSRWP